MIPPLAGRGTGALAVTSSKRASALPELPTVDESGVRGFEVTAWGALLGPRQRPHQ